MGAKQFLANSDGAGIIEYMLNNGLSLRDSPHAAQMVTEELERRSIPVKGDNVYLWVGHSAYQKVAEKARQLPYFPILEPADLWAPEGIALYEGGFVPQENGGDPNKRGMGIVAHRWFSTPDGLAMVEFVGGNLSDYLSYDNFPTPYVSRRVVNKRGPDQLFVESPARPGKVLTLSESGDTIFLTPGSEPILAYIRISIMWPWGSPVELVESDFEDPLSQEDVREALLLTHSYYEPGEPDMERAAIRRNMSPFPVLRNIGDSLQILWTLMQTASAPLSSLPRRIRRPLERDKQQAYRRVLNSLWVVDIPELIGTDDPAGRVVTDGAPGRKHTYRYPVRGHWRNQWYPSTQSHKPIWIEDHIRGPHSAPLYDARSEWAKQFPIYRLRLPPDADGESGYDAPRR